MNLSEFEVIQELCNTNELVFPRDGVRLGIGDDGAVLSLPQGRDLVLAMDTAVANIHFPADAPAEFIAHRVLVANLSDIAAMGAQPLSFTLSLVAPEVKQDWLGNFASGLARLAQLHDCPLVGGDVSQGPLIITIEVQGVIDPGAVITRSGAQTGDSILVTGYPGDAALGLALLRPEFSEYAASLDPASLSSAQRQHLEAAYFQSEPRLAFGMGCAHLVNSGIDISDGLDGDLKHILRASGRGAVVDLEALPCSAAALACTDKKTSAAAALFGGDDYELCFTAPPERLPRLQELAAEIDLPLHCIGKIVADAGLKYRDGHGQAVQFSQQSYTHFRSGAR